MSNLGGSVHGKSPLRGYSNSLTGSEVSMKRKILRKSFGTNIINKDGNVHKSTIGPFRSSFHLGDRLSRKHASCGGCNQVNGTSVNKNKVADSVSNKDCNLVVNGLTVSDVPIGNGNNKYVSDSSLYTRFKNLDYTNRTYNDVTFGGNNNNSVTSALNRVR